MANYLVITGPSGAGKTTLINMLIIHNECFKLNVSYTSRKPRANEINGIHYHFITEENFIKHIKNGFFIEFTYFGGNYYGTAKEENNNGVITILDLDIYGFEFFKKNSPDAYFCLVIADLKNIESRLKNRLESLASPSPIKHEDDKNLEWRLKSVDNFKNIANNLYFNEVIVTDEMDHEKMLAKALLLSENVKKYYERCSLK